MDGIKNKVAEAVYENSFSIHTITFGQQLTSREHKDLNKILFQYREKHHCNSYSNELGEIRFNVMKEYGVNYLATKIYGLEDYGDYTSFHFIITVNLRVLHGIRSYPFICILPNNLINGTLMKMDAVFRECGISSIIKSERLYINRIDFCTNIRCSSIDEKLELLRIARKGRRIYNSEIYLCYSESGKRNVCPTDSFTLKGKSFEFTVYDKHSNIVKSKYQYDESEIIASEKQIRIELRIKGNMIGRIRKKEGMTKKIMRDTANQRFMEILHKLSRDCISGYLEKIYPASGIFYAFPEAKEHIMESNLHKKTKEKMIKFMKKTSKTGLDGAISWYKEKYGKKECQIINKFRKLQICPITLSTRSQYEYLPGFLYYIENCNMNELSKYE